MPVYVDSLIDHPPREHLRFSRWCHMVADTLEELHAMADLIGQRREWFQDRHEVPHYDLPPGQRQLAVENGAIEITRRELAIWIRKRRAMMD